MQNHTPDIPGIKLGMWLFLYTEVMLFGGLFVLYAAYYAQYQTDFIAGGKELNRLLGGINTVALLLSSFAVAAAITAVRQRRKKLGITFVGFAMAMGAFFLVNKYIEWGHKFEVGIYPGSAVLEDAAPGKSIFFGLYYIITGLHGIHIVIGMVLLGISTGLIAANRIHADRYVVLENSGLYWHLVDLIWIFIFPLFYLIL